MVVTSIISMFGSFLPSALVGFSTTKLYPGVGADIVMGSPFNLEMQVKDSTTTNKMRETMVPSKLFWLETS